MWHTPTKRNFKHLEILSPVCLYKACDTCKYKFSSRMDKLPMHAIYTLQCELYFGTYTYY